MGQKPQQTLFLNDEELGEGVGDERRWQRSKMGEITSLPPNTSKTHRHGTTLNKASSWQPQKTPGLQGVRLSSLK